MANYSIDGNWFHSRSSSNYAELRQVKTLVDASQKAAYYGLHWAAGRGSTPLLYRFAGEIGVKPSTMQTKIRAMIRYGFVRETDACPLAWTRLGGLWNDLCAVGNEKAAHEVYRITLAHALALFAFDESGFAKTPDGAMFPLQRLLRATKRNSITSRQFHDIIDGKTGRIGKNEAYWRADLINSGLFEPGEGCLTVSDKFMDLARAIREFSPAATDFSVRWRESRANQLWQSAPFREALRNLLGGINRADASENMLLPLESAFAETLEYPATPRDYNLQANSKTASFTALQRNAAWGRFVKMRYDFSCAVPKCDARDHPFIESAHIKPHSAKELRMPHRAHILNGICLCKHCHTAFDRGLFSLDAKSRVIISARLTRLRDQHPKRVIEQSKGAPMRLPVDGPEPLQFFIRYHRDNVFCAG